MRAGRARSTTSSCCSPSSSSCTATGDSPTTRRSSPGSAFFHGQPVAIIGHQKGRDTKQKIYRNFGYAKPEGYRKALRVMQMAEKFKRPVIVFVDTPAAYPGIESEERGVAEAIALNLREMALLDTPIVVLVCGEGGSGGALGHRRGRSRADAGVQRLQRDSARGLRGHSLARRGSQGARRPRRSRSRRPICCSSGIIDEIVEEPTGGAHLDYAAAAALVDAALVAAPGDAAGDRVRPTRLERALRTSSAAWVGSVRRSSTTARAGAQAAGGGAPADGCGGSGRTSRWTPRRSRAVAEALGVPAGDGAPAVPARPRRSRGGAAVPGPRLAQLHDPFRAGRHARGGRTAASAPSRGANAIVVHGDYDVDGITATVILRRAIELLGGDVTHFVPDRLKDGYGLQPVDGRSAARGGRGRHRVGRLWHPRRRSGRARARELGVDLIITDHHEPDADAAARRWP